MEVESGFLFKCAGCGNELRAQGDGVTTWESEFNPEVLSAMPKGWTLNKFGDRIFCTDCVPTTKEIRGN